MKHIILCAGLPGSGKSTWAKAQIEKYPDRYKRVNRDDLRAMIDNGKWSKAREAYIKQAELALAELYLSAGFHIIIDDSNLSASAKTMWREFARDVGAQIRVQDFTGIPLQICIERDLKRPHSVGERVIRRMHRQFIQQPIAPPAYDLTLPAAIMCDLDGTLALLGNRDPYDATHCEQDQLNGPIADIVAQFAANSHTILFTTGRDERFREQTLLWLKHHGFNFLLLSEQQCSFRLFMRAEKDNRPDEVIKREIYEQHIQNRYNVRFALDDRQKIVDLWRSLGLTCLQVAEGDH